MLGDFSAGIFIVDYKKLQKEIFMKTRQEIKALAKQSFSENYWVCVGATLLAFVVIGAASGVTSFGWPGWSDCLGANDGGFAIFFTVDLPR